MALPNRPLGTFLGTRSTLFDIPVIPVSFGFNVPSPNLRIRETVFTTNCFIGPPGTAHLKGIPFIRRCNPFILGVHPMFSIFPVAPIVLYAKRPLPNEPNDTIWPMLNPFVLRNLDYLGRTPRVDLPLVRYPRMDIVPVPRSEAISPNAGAVVLRGPRHVVPFRSQAPRTPSRRLLIEYHDTNAASQSLPSPNQFRSLEQQPPCPTRCVTNPFAVQIMETSPIHPFSSSYVAYVQWTSYRDLLTANEVPQPGDTVSILLIARKPEVLAPRRVTGFHIYVEEAIKFDDGNDTPIDSSTPLFLCSSPQSLLLPSAAVTPAIESVLNADPSMKHLASGEVAQNDGAVPEITPLTGDTLSMDSEAILSPSGVMMIYDSPHDDCTHSSTALDISTVMVPDLFGESPTSEPSFPRIRLPQDTLYFKQMAPNPSYDTDNGVCRDSPELPVTKVAFRHKQRAGGSIKLRPPQATRRWRIKKGRILDCDDWAIPSFASSMPDSVPSDGEGPTSVSVHEPTHPARTPFQPLYSNGTTLRDPTSLTEPQEQPALLYPLTSPCEGRTLSVHRIFDASRVLYSW